MASDVLSLRAYRRIHLRMSRRRWLAVVAAAVVAAMIGAMGLQAVPGLGSSGGKSSGSPSAFATKYGAMMRSFVARTASLEQAGRASATNSTQLIDVYRTLEHETNSVLATAQSLHPDAVAVSAYRQLIGAMSAEDRDLRAVVAAGDANDMAALRSGITALVNDLQLLGNANSAVEGALKG